MFDWYVLGSFVGYLALMLGIGFFSFSFCIGFFFFKFGLQIQNGFFQASDFVVF